MPRLVLGTRTARAADGLLEITLYTATTSTGACIVSCNDLPASRLAPDELNRMLDNLGSGAMSNIGATLDRQTAIELDGHLGRDITGRTTVQGQDAVVRARVYLVDNRMIQAMVLAAKGQVTDASMTSYLASLTLVK